MRQPVSSRIRSIARRPRKTRVGVESLEARALLALNPLSSIPLLHSLPGAVDSIYLDFDGHFEPVWSTHNNVTTPAYDVDGDAQTFSDQELANIQTIWAAVSEDYAPFKIDVTTVQPSVLAPGQPIAAANGVALRVAIGGTPDAINMSGSSGYSYFNSYTNSVANVAYVFSADPNYSVGSVAIAASHEAGHAFGLQHLSGSGTYPTWSPIMSAINYGADASTWSNGTISGTTAVQDDMAVIASSTNTFGYRADDHGNTVTSATALTRVGDAWSGSGIVGSNTDVDMFSFTISVQDTYRMAVSPAAIGPNLDAVLELRSSSGTLIESASPIDGQGASIVQYLTPGSYRLAVKSTGVYGWIGQYTVSVGESPAEVTVTPASSLMATAEDGRQTTFQVVLQAQPLANVVFPISSSNVAEGVASTSSLVFTPANWNVPQTVTITGVAEGIVDGDVAYDVVIGAAASSDPHYDGVNPTDVAVINIDNDAAGFIYRVDHSTDVIERDRLSGSQSEVLVDLKSTFGSTVNHSPHGIAVDPASGQVYWTDATTHGIYRANLDGSGAELVVSAATGNLTTIALDSAAGKMYWSDAAAHTIRRANLDGSHIETLTTDPSSNIWGIALDVNSGKLYWTDMNQHRVSRANLDGSNIEILWTGDTSANPGAIALDLAAGKMYWCDASEDVIRRADLDGSNVEVVVDATTYATTSNIYGLALDVPAGKIYWSAFGLGNNMIYRSNLDGSAIVPIVSGSFSYSIAVAHPAPGISVTHRTGLATTEAGGSDVLRVSLSTKPTAPVTISVSSSDATEGAVSTSSLTFTPENWNVTQSVTITGVDDALIDGPTAYSIILGPAVSADPLYHGLDPADASAANSDDDVLPTKFYVVDDGGGTYEYSATGVAVENYAAGSGNTDPRGAASTSAGDKVWVVDANKKVYVYDTSGGLLGSWTAGSLAWNATVEGIATNGTDVWIVDARADKIYRYADAASRLSGSQNAASSFNLNSGNRGPKDIVTDGVNLWVVNNASTDKVFKYTISGSLVGSWTIAGAGSSPTGITLDPTGGETLWIVDSSSDRVYQFDNARSRTSGSPSPSTSFALAAGDTNPQGIADPPTSRSPLASTSANGEKVATNSRSHAASAFRRRRLSVENQSPRRSRAVDQARHDLTPVQFDAEARGRFRTTRWFPSYLRAE